MIKPLATALLAVTFGAIGVAHAEDQGDLAHKEMAQKEWSHHERGGLWELLPADKVNLLQETMEKVREENRPLHEQERQLATDLDTLLKAPQFDQGLYLKKSAELDSLRDRAKKNKDKAFAAVAAKFTMQERKVLAVMRHMHRDHHAGGRWQHHEGGMHDREHNRPDLPYDGEQKNRPVAP